MNTKTWLAAVVSAFVAGALFVVACGDDSPGGADAATCDCPAAEPPLAGRIQAVKNTDAIPANGLRTVAAGCPSGSTILGGGCRMNDGAALTQAEGGIDRSGGPSGAYWCTWRSTAGAPTMVTAEAICLIPAP